MLFEALLYAPPRIALGLLTGKYTRWGSVIRDTANGRIIAHLREGQRIANDTEFASKLLESVLQASTGDTVGALNLVATALSHRQIMSQLSRLQTLVGVVGGIGVLNLALSAVSFGLLLNRLNELEVLIEGLYEHVSLEHRYDRQARLESATTAANNAIEMTNESNRKLQANLAINMINEARSHVWRDFTAFFGSAPTLENNQLMLGNLLQAMRLDTILVRCYMEINEFGVARQYLETRLEEYQEPAKWLVHKCLGDRRAAFFHCDAVTDNDFYRYVAIEQWLRNKDDILLDLVLANRPDFWNKDLMQSSENEKKRMKALGRLALRKTADNEDVTFQQTALEQAELLIENLDRLRGFKAEIEAIERLGISSADWKCEIESALDEADIDLAEHNDYVLLVDKEWLAEQSD